MENLKKEINNVGIQQVTKSEKSRYFHKVGLIFIVFVNILAIFISYQLYQVSQEIQSSNKELMQGLKNNKVFEEVQNANAAILEALKHDIILKELKKNNEKITKELKDDIEIKNTKMYALLLDELSKNLKNKAKDVVDNLNEGVNKTIQLANSKIIRNEKEADIAFDLANKYIEEKDFILSRIYLLNAINHNPTKLEYITILFNLLEQEENLQSISESRAILQLSLYQLNPNDIEKVLNYLTKLDEIEHGILSVQEASLPQIDLTNEFKNISQNTKFDLICFDIKKQYDVLDRLTNILKQMSLEYSKYAKIIPEIEIYSKGLQNIARVTLVVDQIDGYIKLLKDEKDYSSQKASSRLISAKTALTLLWKYDLSALPTPLSQKIEKEFVDSLNKYELKIQERKSIKYFTTIEALSKEKVTGNNQAKIEKTTNIIKAIAIENQNIIHLSTRVKVIEIIQSLQKNILLYKREQYKQYQIWAANNCYKALNDWNDELSVNDKEAKKFFNKYKLSAIDASIISPEINMVYQKVIQYIIGELNSEDGVKIQTQLMLHNKKKLEDF